MLIAAIDGVTRLIGKTQGYLGLPLRDEIMNCTVNGEGTPAMVMAWQLTPDELACPNTKTSVHLRVLGTVHPPMMVGVDESPA